jgi:hypothetical protein
MWDSSAASRPGWALLEAGLEFPHDLNRSAWLLLCEDFELVRRLVATFLEPVARAVPSCRIRQLPEHLDDGLVVRLLHLRRCHRAVNEFHFCPDVVDACLLILGNLGHFTVDEGSPRAARTSCGSP